MRSSRSVVLIALAAFGLALGACGGDEGPPAQEAGSAIDGADIGAAKAPAAPTEAAPPQEGPPPEETVKAPTIPPDIALSLGDAGEPAAQRAPEDVLFAPVVALDVPVVYASDEDGDSEIHLLSPDGGTTRLTDNDVEDRNPALSPDGSQVAFHTFSEETAWDIYVVDADGSGLTQLTSGPEVDAHAAWSPDGSRIAFHSNRGGTWEVWVMNADGSEPTQVSSNGGEVPAFSPDGRLVWSADANGDGVYSLYLAKADGSNLSAVTPEDEWAYLPSWSPDGSTIAYESDADGDWDVYVVNADGSATANLTPETSIDGAPAFLPDGRIIVHSDRNGEANFDVFVMAADGSGVGQVTTGAANDWGPAAASAPIDGGGDGDGLAALLSHVPEDIRPTCEPSDPWYPNTLAQVYCGIGDIGVSYIQFADAEGLHAAYDSLVGDLRDQGFCDTDEASEGPFYYGEETAEAGRLLCFEEAGVGRWAVWQTEELLIFAAALHTGGDRAALYDFWTTAGPWRSGPVG